ncbi:MAG: hypothetical protein ACYSOV_01095, partial [Planctomycetota bacterium]
MPNDIIGIEFLSIQHPFSRFVSLYSTTLHMGIKIQSAVIIAKSPPLSKEISKISTLPALNYLEFGCDKLDLVRALSN